MGRPKKENVFPNYIRVREPDHAALAEIVLAAKGENRSVTEFANDCGVSPSTLSRIVNEKNRGPCSDALIKTIAEKADPGSGVTVECLLEAHGLAPVVIGTENINTDAHLEPGNVIYSNQSDTKEMNFVTTECEALTPTDIVKTLVEKVAPDDDDVTKSSGAFIRRSAEYMAIKNWEAFESDARSIIFDTLVKRGHSANLIYRKRNEMFDFEVRTDALSDDRLRKWVFEVKIGRYSMGQRTLDRLFRDLYLGGFYDRGIKVSLVIGDLRAFEAIREQYWETEIYDAVSVILLDRVNHRVADEFNFLQKGHGRAKSVLM